MDLTIGDWPIIRLTVRKTDGSWLDAGELEDLNGSLRTVDSDGNLSINEVISDPDESTVDLLMEAKKALDDHGVDFSGEIYFVNTNGSGIVRWVVDGDMVVDTVNVEDPAYPSYGDGDPVDVTFPDGVRVHAQATE